MLRPAGTCDRWCVLCFVLLGCIWIAAQGRESGQGPRKEGPAPSVQGLIGIDLAGSATGAPPWITDRRGLFVPGVRVGLRRVGGSGSIDRVETPSCVTDQRGRYSFAAVPPGRYRLAFGDESIETCEGEESLVVSRGAVYPRLQLVRSRPGRVFGQVVLRDGEPLFEQHAAFGIDESARIELIDENGAVLRRTTTNSRGLFMIAGVEPGRHLVRARLQSLEISKEILVDDNDAFVDLSAPNAPPRLTSVRAFQNGAPVDWTKGGLVELRVEVEDEDGDALRVLFRGPGHTTEGSQPAASGSFRRELSLAMRSGIASIYVWVTDDRGGFDFHSLDLPVGVEHFRFEGVVETQIPGSVPDVTDGATLPVEDALVVIDDGRRARSDEHGRFAFVVPRSFWIREVQVSKEGFRSFRASLSSLTSPTKIVLTPLNGQSSQSSQRAAPPPGKHKGKVPQDGGFLDFIGQDDMVTALAYYEAVDPNHQKTTFPDWQVANGFHLGDDVNAIYFNNGDLGFGRNMHMKETPQGLAFYVVNHPSVEEARLSINQKATVAMEYSAHPSGGNPYIKYFVFQDRDGDGALERHPDADLDGRGLKLVPSLCISCHGGTRQSLDALGNYPNSGDVGAQFIAFDLNNFQYSSFESPPGSGNRPFSRESQEDEFRRLNQAILSVDAAVLKPALRELIEGWYGGTGLPRLQQDSAFVPVGWSAAPENAAVYLDVIRPSCRACHTTRDAPIDWARYSNTGLKEFGYLARYLVCDACVMPNAKVSYDSFWHSFDPRRPEVLGNAGLNNWSPTDRCPVR